MKKINVFKVGLYFVFAFAVFSCSKDSIEEQNLEKDFDKVTNPIINARGSGDCKKTIDIAVEYDFPWIVLPNGQILTVDPATQAQIKQDYIDEMSAYFTICSITTTNCDNVDIWSVDFTEYQNYINSPGYGEGGNNSQSSGTLKEMNEVATCL